MNSTVHPSGSQGLPTEINSKTMVIRSQRTTFRHVIDLIVTLLAWFAFLYLLIRGIWAVGTNQIDGLGMPFFSRALPSMESLAVYGIAMLVQAVLLLLWALYNWSRFHGKTRRSNNGALPDEALTKNYGIQQNTLTSLRNNSISVIHHTHDGRITSITHPANSSAHSNLLN